MMHGHEKSDSSIVPVKRANADADGRAEPVEGREGAKGNVVQAGTRRTPSRISVSPGLDRVRPAAKIASPSLTRGGSPVPELGTPGSVRGARGDSRPYRDVRP